MLAMYVSVCVHVCIPILAIRASSFLIAISIRVLVTPRALADTSSFSLRQSSSSIYSFNVKAFTSSSESSPGLSPVTLPGPREEDILSSTVPSALSEIDKY
jgi:hypothetical protein